MSGIVFDVISGVKSLPKVTQAITCTASACNPSNVNDTFEQGVVPNIENRSSSFHRVPMFSSVCLVVYAVHPAHAQLEFHVNPPKLLLTLFRLFLKYIHFINNPLIWYFSASYKGIDAIYNCTFLNIVSKNGRVCIKKSFRLDLPSSFIVLYMALDDAIHGPWHQLDTPAWLRNTNKRYHNSHFSTWTHNINFCKSQYLALKIFKCSVRNLPVSRHQTWGVLTTIFLAWVQSYSFMRKSDFNSGPIFYAILGIKKLV